MDARYALRRLRVNTFSRRRYDVPDGPVVSFTFDDFPKSALDVGGGILRSYESVGTYYAAPGLLGIDNHHGPHFSAEDLLRVIADGHELGSHTHAHVSGRGLTPELFREEALMGRRALEELQTAQPVTNFSYPFGYATVALKRGLGDLFASCRSIYPGVNGPSADLNLLRANSLYHSSFDEALMANLITDVSRSRGWLIFYTHDVVDTPSPYGCTARELDTAVRLVHQRGIPIRTVGQVLATASS